MEQPREARTAVAERGARPALPPQRGRRAGPVAWLLFVVGLAASLAALSLLGFAMVMSVGTEGGPTAGAAVVYVLALVVAVLPSLGMWLYTRGQGWAVVATVTGMVVTALTALVWLNG